MIEWILNGAQIGYNMGWITVELFTAIIIGGWGWQLYSNVKKPTDAWDEFLKGLSIGMMALGVIDLLVIVFRLM